MDIKSLLKEMWKAMERYDLSEDYLKEKGCELPKIGEFQYGASSVPCEWVYPYLYVMATDPRLKGILSEIEDYPAAFLEPVKE